MLSSRSHAATFAAAAVRWQRRRIELRDKLSLDTATARRAVELRAELRRCDRAINQLMEATCPPPQP